MHMPTHVPEAATAIMIKPECVGLRVWSVPDDNAADISHFLHGPNYLGITSLKAFSCESFPTR